jgi:hypothetical protein
MQTLCPMNVHRRKTQKIEFKKKEKKKRKPRSSSSPEASPRRSNTEKKLRAVPRFFFQQQQRETNLYFPLTTNNKNGQVCPISRLSLRQKKTERERRRKRRRKAQEGAITKLAPKNNRSAPACYLLPLGKQQ